jgi:hypothetical protein
MMSSMTLALLLAAVVALLELGLWLPFVWNGRRVISVILAPLLAVSTTWLLLLHPSGWTIFGTVLSVYRLVNLLRIAKAQTHADYLYHSSRKTAVFLIGWQALLAGAAWINHLHNFAGISWWYLVAGLQLAMALVLAASTRRHLRTTEAPHVSQHYADRDLPSLTVAIPARNETDDLDACLQSLIGSNYPKMEILVLDDCSQNKRTPEIIRAFAHDGVRFIAGKEPAEGWLAKNYAYQQLTDEANGRLLLFCGVDVRFSSDSLRELVETMLVKRKSMFSLMPINQVPAGGLGKLLLQPSRYAWEMSLPRRWLNRPPVLSTCWLITADALHAAGSFKSIMHKSSPESYFARQVAKNSDGYSFMQSDARLGIFSAKSLSEQRDTAVRTRYPQTHRRPELVGLLSLVELAALVLPYGQLGGGLAAHEWSLAGLGALSVLALTNFYSRIVTLTYRHRFLGSIWLLPVAAVYDVWLLNYSMWQYEFNEVIWKGRNVCIPVMHTVPSLPKML